MHKIWVVVKREFLVRVRTKWFVISTVLGPVLIGALVFLPVLMAGRGAADRRVAIVDASESQFGEKLAAAMTAPPVTAVRLEVPVADIETVAESLAAVVGEKRLDGMLIVTDRTVRDGNAVYRGSNVSAQLDMQRLRRILERTVLTERLEQLGVDPAMVNEAQSVPVSMQTVSIRGGETTEESGEAMFFLAYFMWFLLYMAILLYGVQVMGAVVEEKTTRVIEVLVSSLRPFQLLAGKVLGVGAVGLFQLAIWAAAGRLFLTRRDLVSRMLGVDAAAFESVKLPEIPMETIVVMLVYFVLGYFLYAAMFAAVAAMSSSEAEARQAQTPVTMVLVIPAIVSLMAMINQPDGGLFVALTLIPFSSPISMPGRWVVTQVPLVELLASIAFLVIALILVTWVAGRIYRVGILMYGKRPSPAELLRWIRAR